MLKLVMMLLMINVAAKNLVGVQSMAISEISDTCHFLCDYVEL